MRLSVVLALAALSGSNAFVPAKINKFGVSSLSASVQQQQEKTEGTVCDIPTDVEVPDLLSEKGSANKLRSAVLTNAAGDFVRLDDQMGDGTSVVVFLRHLG